MPRGVAVDGSGNVYIADTANGRVRMVTTAGTISTFASIKSPRGLTVSNGSLYVTGGARIWAVTLGTGTVTAYAGSLWGYDGDGHALLSSLFTVMGPITFDSSGNAYIPDIFNGRLRKATSGTVNTFAGGYIGDGATATSAALALPEAITFDKSGNTYIADFTGNRVRKVSAGKISTIAGTGVSGFSGNGGPATSAMLNAPQGVAVDSAGNVYIADTYNNLIRKVSGGTISTFASSANFSYLLQMTTDAANNLYVADNGACVVWKITPATVISIVAGVLNTCGYNGDNITATTAQLNQPYSVALDKTGNLYITDYANNRIREVDTSGMISTIVGDGNCFDTGDGGSATAAEICLPYGVAVNPASNVIYTTDGWQNVRQISGGIITGYGGTGINAYGFDGDGLWPMLTDFQDLVAVAVSPKGVVTVLDDVQHRARQIH